MNFPSYKIVIPAQLYSEKLTFSTSFFRIIKLLNPYKNFFIFDGDTNYNKRKLVIAMSNIYH